MAGGKRLTRFVNAPTRSYSLSDVRTERWDGQFPATHELLERVLQAACGMGWGLCSLADHTTRAGPESPPKRSMIIFGATSPKLMARIIAIAVTASAMVARRRSTFAFE